MRAEGNFWRFADVDVLACLHWARCLPPLWSLPLERWGEPRWPCPGSKMSGTDQRRENEIHRLSSVYLRDILHKLKSRVLPIVWGCDVLLQILVSNPRLTVSIQTHGGSQCSAIRTFLFDWHNLWVLPAVRLPTGLALCFRNVGV